MTSFGCLRLLLKIRKSTDLAVKCMHRSFSESKCFDVVISGGGMVGAAMAAALAHEPVFADKKILLLEAGPQKSYDRVPPVHSSRVCALSPGTIKLLSEFGAWDNIRNVRYREVKRMQVWEACSNAMITFNQDQLTDNLAYIVENDIILGAIMKQVESMRGQVELLYNAKVKRYGLTGCDNVEEARDLTHVELENGDTYSSRLLIGADGFKSLLRQTAGFHTVNWEYNQFAVVATLKLAEGVDNNTAWQRFLPTGPIALLPLSDDYSCLIWTTTPENGKTLLQLPIESFVDAVNNAFWSEDDKNPTADYISQAFDSVLTTIGLDGSTTQQLPPTVIDAEATTRGMFPLGLCHSSQYVKNRVAIIGDAAHRVHPLAGQGVNLGFGDVRCLRDKLAESVYNGQDLGSITPLLDYERERQLHVVPMMAAVDGLNRLYSNSWTPLILARCLGTQATNALRPLKDQLILRATS